ncbi:MAG: PAS domain-containing protein, partial [Planctomycetota bacterium]
MNESDATHADNDAETRDNPTNVVQRERVVDSAIRSCPAALNTMVSEVPWVMDSKGRLVWVHPASESLYSCKADDLLGDASNRLRYIHAEDRKHVTDTWSRLAKEKRVELEYRIVVDGKKTERVSETIVSLNPDHPGHFGGLTRVVTDRHHLEGALRDSEAVYLSLVESLPLSVLRKDSRGRIQYANARACEQMGKPVEELIGRSDFD